MEKTMLVVGGILIGLGIGYTLGKERLFRLYGEVLSAEGLMYLAAIDIEEDGRP